MSPRRMDISSLLRDPTPPPNPPPASLLHILNNPDSLQLPPRPPFLGLDALVHVASEERRRIAAVPDKQYQRDLPFIAHDHDRPSGFPLHPPPLHRHPDLSFQDNLGPHKRIHPPSPPHSPSPEPSFPLIPGRAQLTSPRTRQHPSASPTNSYPTLRQQPTLHMEPTRATPTLLVNDARTIAHPPSLSLQHSSPFLRSPHPPLLAHSSPRNSSPNRHSPQHVRSQRHPPLVHTGPLISASAEADLMSPRYGHGPRMAGGIEILSNDPSSLRDLPRPDLSNYQSPNISPLSARSFPMEDDRHQATPPHRAERVRFRPPHSPLGDPSSDIANNTWMPAMDTDSPSHLPERHPTRVWEERPIAREAPRRVSPARSSGVVSGLAEGDAWLAASESGHTVQPAEDRATAFRQDLVENVPPLLSTCKEPPPPLPGHRSSESLAPASRTCVERICLDPQPTLPISIQPGIHAQLPQTLYLNSSIVSPVLDLRLENFETRSELRPECTESQADGHAGAPLTSSTAPMHVDVDVDVDTNPLSYQSSPELIQSSEPGTFRMLTPSAYADVSQHTSRSPSQQPFSVPFLIEDERKPSPENMPISPPIQADLLSSRSSDLGHTTEGRPPVSEQAMMDVDEELLSLVEDRPVCTVPATPKTQIDSKLPLLITVSQTTSSDAEQRSGEASDGPSLVPQPMLKGPLITGEEKDRASMPPPTVRSRKAEKDKTTLAAVGSRKKKDGTSKPAAKPKPAPKPRAKPTPKPKAKFSAVDHSLKVGIPKGVINANTRSRSTSVIPGTVDDVAPEPEADDSDKEDDKLYCVCKTRYDEDRMMIACDRCDEWFHTLCVGIPDPEIDLVDQFICPPCMQKHPHLRTTWKRRCLFGLQHEKPSSPEACHKPSRGVFSKYCSDDCGIKYMQARITQWEKSGGVRDLLWESVKNASKREGVVVYAVTNGSGLRTVGADSNGLHTKPFDSATKRRADREVARLNTRLEEVVRERELMKRELDMVMWREKVVELASERAGKVDECGWDQRLCFGEEEWADFGSEVLESYEEERVKAEPGDDAMPLDATSTVHGEWWCTGKKKCERHAGWQKLRTAETSFDKETKEGILLKLTTREREIRKCIEDILYPQPTGVLLAPSHPEVQLNGPEKPCDVSGRGKKRSS